MTTFRTANPLDQLPPGTKFLILVDVGVFLLQMALPGWFVYTFGLTPDVVIHKYWVWQIFTYSFLHGNGWHLFLNMFALWMFGPQIESIWGTRTYLRYFFICATGAAAAQFLLAPESLVVGASGGIYGLLIAFGLMFPDSVIYLFFVFPLRAIQAVLFIALLTLVSAIGTGGSRVAHFAHLGGMLVGFLYLKAPVWKSDFRMWRAERLFRNPKGPKPRRGLPDPADLRQEVDRILEKISQHGIDSLTSDEHRTMKRYAERKQ